MQSAQRRVLLGAFVYIVAANIPAWIAGHVFGLMVRGLFGIDFLVVGIVSIYLRRAFSASLLLITILLDLLHCVTKTYLFSPSELLRSASGGSDFALSHLWGIAILASSLAIACFGAMAAPYRNAKKEVQGQIVPVFLIVLFCFGAVDFSRGQLPINHPDGQLGSIRLLRGVTESLVLEEWNHQKQMDARRLRSSKGFLIKGASSMLPIVRIAASTGAGSNRPNIVMVLVESWGSLFSPAIGSSLKDPYQGEDINSIYRVSSGTVPFNGLTIDGETRELCGNMLGLNIMTASASRLQDCLPAKLASEGYNTIAVHGFTSRFYSRINWYRQAQFNETWFREQLEKQGLPSCHGAFPGVCDEPISDWIGDRLSRNGSTPQFVYWVTLNSHLPVPIPNDLNMAPSCSMIKRLSGSSAICSWYQLIYNVHRSVSKLALREGSTPTIFVIVGDHAPPFANPELRNLFSDEVVPYVVLLPKKIEKEVAQLQTIAPPLTSLEVKNRRHSAKRRQTPSKG